MSDSNTRGGGPTGVSVGVGEVLSSAWGSFKNQIGTHLIFSVLWVLGLLLSSCLMSCCIMVPFAGALGASSEGGGSAERIEGMMGLIAVVYLVMIAFLLVVMSFHQGVTIAITVSDLRGRSLAVGDAIAEGMRRVLPQSLFALLRMVADLVIFLVIVGAPAGILIAQSAGAPRVDAEIASDPEGLTGYLVLVGVAYFAAIACVVASRSFHGLGPAAVAIESVGPVAAFSRSSSLLAGNRGSYFLAKLVVLGIGLVVYFALVMAIMGLGVMGGPRGASGASDSNPAISLLMLPLVLLGYGGMLVVYTFDHAVEGAFFAKLTKAPPSGPDVADVFR